MVLMTLIDLVIVSVTMASLWILFGQRYRLIRSKLILGLSIVLVGLVTIGLFYLTDLFVMLVLPLLSSKPTAMALMEDLHLNYRDEWREDLHDLSFPGNIGGTVTCKTQLGVSGRRRTAVAVLSRSPLVYALYP